MTSTESLPASNRKERVFYEPVARWAKSKLGCFATGVDTGLRHSRIDVVGLRDAGGRLSGRAEVIAIEVKRGRQPFATTVGQAAGYSVYADRVYLADHRTSGFTDDHVAIASALGVGLIHLSGEKRVRINEVLSPPQQNPLEGLRLEVVEKLHHSLCTICGTFFRRGEPGSYRAHVTPQQPSGTGHLSRAAGDGKGVMYWLREHADRMGYADSDIIYNRRYVCPDCITALFGSA
jgi:hypothetical protein